MDKPLISANIEFRTPENFNAKGSLACVFSNSIKEYSENINKINASNIVYVFRFSTLLKNKEEVSNYLFEREYSKFLISLHLNSNERYNDINQNPFSNTYWIGFLIVEEAIKFKVQFYNDNISLLRSS